MTTPTCPHANAALSSIWDGSQSRQFCGLCGDYADGLGSIKDRKKAVKQASEEHVLTPTLSSSLTLSTCAGYDPRTQRLGDWTACPGDGHSQCPKCVHHVGRAP